MLLKTRDFGEIDYEGEIITFSQPLYGFEKYTNFVIISEENTNGYLAWLQSADEPSLCFIVLNPEAFEIDYSFEIEDEYLDKLGDGEYEVWLLTIIKDDFENATVNLRSPIIINRDNNKCIQAMLDSSFPLRCPVYST